MTLTDAAVERGLVRLADMLRPYQERGWISAAAPPHSANAPSDAIKLLSAFARSGLQPNLIAALGEHWADRRVDRALVGWDALNGAVWAPSQQPLVEQLRSWATDAVAVLPLPGRRGFPAATMLARELVTQSAAPRHRGTDDDDLLAAMIAHDLGAYVEFVRRHPDDRGFLDDEKLLDATARSARLLALSHLPTVASFYQQFLWTEFRHVEALGDLMETLLDVGAADFIPTPDLEALPPDHAEYVRCRALAVAGREIEIKALLSNRIDADVDPNALDRGGAGLVLLKAELDTRLGGDGAALSLVRRIAERHPLWRYARRVQAQLAARAFPAKAVPPATMYTQFTETFGSDATFWYLMLLEAAPKGAAWLRATLGQIGAELIARPHEYDAWAALARFFDEKSAPTRAELEQKIEEQAAV